MLDGIPPFFDGLNSGIIAKILLQMQERMRVVSSTLLLGNPVE